MFYFCDRFALQNSLQVERRKTNDINGLDCRRADVAPAGFDSAPELTINYLQIASPTGLMMPRYFFNTRIGKELLLDPEGEDLRDPDQAWNVARTTIRELLSAEGGQDLLGAIMEVSDEEGEIVLEFPFSEAILDFPDDSATRH